MRLISKVLNPREFKTVNGLKIIDCNVGNAEDNIQYKRDLTLTVFVQHHLSLNVTILSAWYNSKTFKVLQHLTGKI